MSHEYRGNTFTLGTNSDGEPVEMSETARRIHIYVSGRTGSGKSRFLLSLLQQDLRQHWRSKQGLLLLDPHGELYDGVLAYIAEHHQLWNLPVVLIDLRKDDWIVSYNLLKQRNGLDSAVVATSFVESITHAFGGANPTETPRLARVARMFIQALFDAKRTLLDLLPLLQHRNGAQREALIAELPQNQVRILLEQLNQLGKSEFDTWVESFTNRMAPLLTNRVLGSMLTQSTAPSFDFDKAIADGAIVLVSLATEHGKIAESDSKLFASLMLSDLWQVAKLRGKKGAGRTKPFAVYADEFQSYLTPTLGAQLDQARGFGLQFILANQYPSQILDHGGDHGRATFRSVMINTGTKIVFQATEQQDERAPLVEALFDGAVDVNRVQENLKSLQVVGYKEVRRILRGGSDADGETSTVGSTTTVGVNLGTTVAEGTTVGGGEARSMSISTGRSTGISRATSVSNTSVSSSGVTMPDGTGLDVPVPVGSTFSSEGSGVSFGESDIDSESETESETSSEGENSFIAVSDSYAEQVVTTRGTAESTTTGLSTTRTDSWSEQVSLEPILEERPTQLMSVENQLFAFGQRLAQLAPQHAYTRLPGSLLPVSFRALDCPETPISRRFIDRRRERIVSRMPCALSFTEAQARMIMNNARTLPDTDAELRTAAAGRRRGRVIVKENGDE